MRRTIAVFLAAILLLCGCANTKRLTEPVKFYYCVDPQLYESYDEVIQFEMRESAGIDDHISLVNQYLEGPESQDFVSYFPAGTQVDDMTLYDATVYLSLSPQFAALSGRNLSLAGITLAMTLFELLDAQIVEISVPDSTLDGRDVLRIHKDNLLFAESIESND